MEKTKVALVSSKGYEEKNNHAIENAIELIGGIERFVRADDVVLIKPNLVNTYDGKSGNVTHFSLIRPIVKACFRAGARKIFVGEGTGDIDTLATIITSGMKKIIDQLRSAGIPVEFIDLNCDRNPTTTEFETVNLGKDALLPDHIYRISNTLMTSDVIISVPKLKTHPLTGITVALKNVIGVAPGEYYGFPKQRKGALPHGDPDNPLKNDMIWRVILDLNRIALGRYPDSPKERRYLAIVDGVVAGIYDSALNLGDQYYLPVWKPHKIGTIIAGSDPVAVDTISARIMGYLPEKIPTINHATKIKLGTMNEIEIVGEKLQNIQSFVPLPKGFSSIADFHNPKLLPKIFYSTLKTNLKWFYNKNKARTARLTYTWLRRHNLA
jgi:uncharacterized protein (DUF362 family)